MKTLPLLMSVVLLAALLHEGGGQFWGQRRRRRSATQCGRLSSPRNGRVSYHSRAVSARAHYWCDHGHCLVGDSTRTCSFGGSWTGSTPTCAASSARCSMPSQPANGQVTISPGSMTFTTPVGGTANFVCDSGYRLLGASSLKCNCDGSWNGSPPVCTNCGNPEIAPNVDYSSRVLGGGEARQHSWPWMVSLRRGYPAFHQCGGALVDSQWVVTSAWCAYDLTLMTDRQAVLGAHDLSEDGTEHDIADAGIIIHDGFDLNAGTMANDIALIKLAAPVPYSDEVYPVCLPAAGSSLSTGTQCVATGWGAKDNWQHSTLQFQDKLRQVVLPVSTVEDCEPYGTSHHGVLPGMAPNTFCAGKWLGGRELCKGDKGSPLVHEQGGVWTLVGVASYSQGSCRSNLAFGTIFTDVAKFRQWIDTKRDNS